MTEATSYDLHVLSTPPAFVLSQNQTLHNIYFRNCWTNELFSSSVPCNHRSETPQGFISAQATARVTTFSFPLFILSDAPPGRLYPVASFSTQPQHLRKSVNLKTASLGLLRASHSSRSAFRAAPCRCAENLTRIDAERQANFSKNFHFFLTFFVNP